MVDLIDSRSLIYSPPLTPLVAPPLPPCLCTSLADTKLGHGYLNGQRISVWIQWALSPPARSPFVPCYTCCSYQYSQDHKLMGRTEGTWKDMYLKIVYKAKHVDHWYILKSNIHITKKIAYLINNIQTYSGSKLMKLSNQPDRFEWERMLKKHNHHKNKNIYTCTRNQYALLFQIQLNR